MIEREAARDVLTRARLRKKMKSFRYFYFEGKTFIINKVVNMRKMGRKRNVADRRL